MGIALGRIGSYCSGGGRRRRPGNDLDEFNFIVLIRGHGQIKGIFFRSALAFIGRRFRRLGSVHVGKNKKPGAPRDAAPFLQLTTKEQVDCVCPCVVVLGFWTVVTKAPFPPSSLVMSKTSKN